MERFLTLELIRERSDYMKDYSQTILAMGKEAKEAARFLRTASSLVKDDFLSEIANQLEVHKEDILIANEKDVKIARNNGLKEALVERLYLGESRFKEMVDGLLQVVSLKDPVGEVDSMWLNEAGLKIGSKRVPLGVIAMIYESRPNVTIDAAALCVKTGNAVILKGGSDALNTNMALMEAVREALKVKEFPLGTVQLVETTDRDFTSQLLVAKESIDCVIPRGSEGLIKLVAETSRIPVIETGTGNCHIYVDRGYNLDNALDIIVNAKVQRPGACNAVETLLINEEQKEGLLEILLPKMNSLGVKLALCEESMKIAEEKNLLTDNMRAAEESDWETEYLDLILAVRVVQNLDEAIGHIDKYSSGHSESILTDNYNHAQTFLDTIDSAAVYVNASTRFTDGGEFGFGAEIGISTQKLHARGPMGLKALTTNKYVVYGNGQYRK
ncbi:MAG: glutamate-5-semialdehyde dehydrogenase [Gudongella sp.]|nr:glutamate-5-semialdehyde dehydrogenase [Gudongella sp.]